MKNVAYKTSKNSTQYPDGFILESVETDEETLEGYTIVDKESFPKLMEDNAALLHKYNQSKNTRDLPNELRSVLLTQVPQPLSAEIKVANKSAQGDAALFQQFLAWKNSQSSGS